MGSTEKFCLRWNDFESNISGAFRELREDKDFFDVTLACDDDQLQAHKLILSACSPFFRTILRRNKHEHPLLYLKGVKYADLVSVLNFMYQGEVNVAQEELNSFLAVAEELKVKGLTQNKADTKPLSSFKTEPCKPHSRDPPDKTELSPPAKRSRPVPPPASKGPSASYHSDDDDDIQVVVPVKSEPVPLITDTKTQALTPMEQEYSTSQVDQIATGVVVADSNMEYGEEYGDYGSYEGESGRDGNKELDEMIEENIVYDQEFDSSKPWQCTQCQKTFKGKGHVKDHIEGTHVVGLSFTCPYCSLEITSRHRLRTHISLKHNLEHKERQIKISLLQPSYQAP
eukprot:GFUD01042297.1.p1 GENE.GFUD01042297.1~~GFUD01042297.1.p1  ORF type:complete len:342 (-),score=84.58 GFUD01042297.1:141-1166(-)